MTAERELSEEQEGELYRHYGGAAEPPAAADEPLPTGGGGLSEASVPEEASVTNDGLVATRQLRVTDPRFAAGAAAVALAVGIWRRETIGRQVSTAVGRLGAVPATVSRRRRRTKALNQAVTGAAQQTAALARAMARLVSGTALLPVRVTVKGGRRARAGVQVTRKAISQGARRVRPGRRRKRRGGTLGMAAGGAAGYVLGAKAGRQRYQEIAESARRFRQRPEVKRITERAVAKLGQLSGQAADKLQAARQSARTEAGSSGGQPITVAPETPTVTPSSLTVVPPADLAPMPAEPTVLPGEDASAAEERQRPAPPDPLP